MGRVWFNGRCSQCHRTGQLIALGRCSACRSGRAMAARGAQVAEADPSVRDLADSDDLGLPEELGSDVAYPDEAG